MKKVRMLSLVLATTLFFCMLTGCIGKIQEDITAITDQPLNTSFPEKINVSKIGSIEIDNIQIGDGGLYYSDDSGKYGILTFDGKNNTGAKYDYCKNEEEYFTVSGNIPSDLNDALAFNSFGLVDVNGKVLIPELYATIDVLNERYARVCEVTKRTNSKDDALVYYTDKMFSLDASEGDLLFKGVWYVYDLNTGMKVSNVSGTKPYNIAAKGNYIEYINDNGERLTVNAYGQNLPEGATLFENGCYRLVKNNEGVVYDSADSKLFTYALDGFVPERSDDQYFIASKSVDGNIKYVLMDKTGKIVTAEFNRSITRYGELINCDYMLYDFEGNKVTDIVYDQLYIDKAYQNAWALKNNDKTFTIIKADGTVIYEGKEDDNLSLDTSNFVIKKKTDNKNLYYSLKDKNFTIEGNAFAPWIIEVADANYVYSLVDVISGETIIKDYRNYTYAYSASKQRYIYAQRAEGGYDIYAVK